MTSQIKPLSFCTTAPKPVFCASVMTFDNNIQSVQPPKHGQLGYQPSPNSPNRVLPISVAIVATAATAAAICYRKEIQLGYENALTKSFYKKTQKELSGQSELIELKNKRLAVVMNLSPALEKPWAQSIISDFAQNRFQFNQGYNPNPALDRLDGAIMRRDTISETVTHKVIAQGGLFKPSFLGGVRLVSSHTSDVLPTAIIKMSGATDEMTPAQKFSSGKKFLNATFGRKLSAQIQTIGELGGMVVVPSARSSGVVNVLYREALEEARIQNIDLLVGTVTHENIGGAPHLTLKNGFNGVIDLSILLFAQLRNGVEGFQLARLYTDQKTELGRSLFEKMKTKLPQAITYDDFLKEVPKNRIESFKLDVMNAIKTYQHNVTEILGRKVKHIVGLDLTGVAVQIFKFVK